MPVHSLFLSKLKPEEREELQKRLLERQSGVCFICDEKIDLALHDVEIDHIVPIAADGKDSENNFALTHELCNRQKSASDLRVAQVLARFQRVEQEAGGKNGTGANLGHILKTYGGAKLKLKAIFEEHTFRFTTAAGNGVQEVITLPVWKDRLSGMSYCFALMPIEYLHHDTRINPRSIGSNLRGLIEEFHHKRPQLHVALAWWSPDEQGEGNVAVFDGQHKAAAQILLGAKELPIRIFIKPNLNTLLEANTNAGDKLRQVAFDAAVKRHLGSTLYKERVDDYQRLKGLGADDLSFSEQDMVKLFKGEHRELTRYIVDAVRDGITHDQDNRLREYIEWAGKGAERPLSYSSVEKTFYSVFLYMKPIDSPLSAMQNGTYPRQIERDQAVKLMSMFADTFFVGKWDTEIGGRKLEDRILKGESIPHEHLRAWRIAREEVLANVLEWIRLTIESYYAYNGIMLDKDRILQRTHPDAVWTNIQNVLQGFAELPCWIDVKLAQTIFGGKPPRDFWRKIFVDGVSPTGIRVLAKGLDLKELIIPKGAVKSAAGNSK